MPESQVKAAPPANGGRRMFLRALSIVIVALVLMGLTSFFTRLSKQRRAPAGFAHGILDGALMPCSLPGLLVGNDVSIYALDNTGRTYKLGYTIGVNGCGAIFFGVFFWRIGRWRKRGKPGNATCLPPAQAVGNKGASFHPAPHRLFQRPDVIV